MFVVIERDEQGYICGVFGPFSDRNSADDYAGKKTEQDEKYRDFDIFPIQEAA